MGRFRRDYRSYHGRSTANEVLTRIAIVLAALVVLVVAVLFFGGDFLVYTDSGPRLELPFLTEKETPPPDVGDVSVVIRPEGSRSEDGSQVTEPEKPATLALELPVEAVLDGSARQKLEEAGANALILEMKNTEGQLSWVSEQPTARTPGVNSGLEGIQEALTQWNQGEVYTIARVCCFRDNTVPYYHNSMALRSGKGNWRDELGLRWLDPTVPETQSYLAGLCGELAQLGFDEIVLDQCALPTKGRQSAISWRGEVDPVGTTEQFFALVEESLRPYETRLSVLLERETLSGENGGLTPVLLERAAYRLWMAEDGESPTLAEALTMTGITEVEDRLVTVGAALNVDNKEDQAVFSGQ